MKIYQESFKHQSTIKINKINNSINDRYLQSTAVTGKYYKNILY